ISDLASLKSNTKRKSRYFFLVNRYVLTFTSSVFLPMITPSLTDQFFSCPSQPSRSLPLNSSIFSGLSAPKTVEQTSPSATHETKPRIGFNTRLMILSRRDLQDSLRQPDARDL